MDRIHRVAYVDTPNTQAEVYKMFSHCGEIRGVYRWTSERDKTHFFIEFRQQESLNRARMSKLLPETHVHSLACIPQLIDRFRSLAEKGGDSIPELPSPMNRRYPRSQPVIQPVAKFGVPTFSSTLDDADFVISTRRHDQDNDKENIRNTKPHSIPSPLPISLAGPAISPGLQLSHNNSATCVIFSICNELVSYDLESLEDDPKGVIALLKLSSCGRDKWMIVGGHYRRKGNSAAAISVVTAMIEAMTCSGVPEVDLKPAFLMLSGCQTDLGKRARTPAGANTEVSLKHFQQSHEWLQKVYGSDPPPQVTDIGARTAETSKAAGPIPKTKSKRPPLLTLPESPLAKTSSCSPSTVGRIRILEREIQSLRDRNSAHQTMLLESQSLKRKLEDELICEKSVRRKVEQKLDQVEIDLQVVKRMETFALEQVKREVDRRRSAEGRENGLLQRVEEMEKEIKKGAEVEKVVLFEDLATMFQKAAQGEGLLLASRMNEEGMSARDGRIGSEAAPAMV